MTTRSLRSSLLIQAACVLAVLVLRQHVVTPLRLAAQQAGTGEIVGTITDRDGGIIPGAAIRVLTGDIRHDVLTNADGQYRVLALRPGSYRVSVAAAGFRTGICQVVVTAGATSDCSLKLVLGVAPDVVVIDGPGLTEAVKHADLIAHVRIRENVRTYAVSGNVVSTDHEVEIVELLKGSLRPQDRTRRDGVMLNQLGAGEWTDLGRELSGGRAKFRPGDEFVMVLERTEVGRFKECSSGRFTFPIANGKTRDAVAGINAGTPLAALIRTLKELVPR
jgi:hypothetical protein